MNTTTAQNYDSMEIAQEILRQLGGRRFIVMTGSKQFLALESGLQFTVGENAKGINRIQVILDPDDTYTVKAFRVAMNQRTGEVKVEEVEAAEGIYNENLQGVFTRLTGLYTRF